MNWLVETQIIDVIFFVDFTNFNGFMILILEHNSINELLFNSFSK